MVSEQDVRLHDGRTLHAYDGGGPKDAFTVLWHHGTPQTGAPLQPVLDAAARRGIRMLSYGRPSYGGSSPQPGRSIASAATDVAAVADALGARRFAVMGASGGGPHALACAALLPERVTGAVVLASPAPLTDEFDWFAGMTDPGALRSAMDGREARARYAETFEFDDDIFTAADWAAVEGRWKALGEDAGRAGSAGPDGPIDDDVAYASPWGFDVKRIEAPVLIAHGGEDRVIPADHGDWLVRHIPNAELWSRPRDGHITVLDTIPVALDWLLANASGPR